MSLHLQREIEQLKKKILSLGAFVEEQVQLALQSFEERDETLASSVIAKDEEINKMEVEVEEDCLKILALHQPVAIDLRFVIAVIKINNDLERIGDLAVNIAERTLSLLSQKKFEIPSQLAQMANKSKAMLKDSLDGLVNFNAELAKKVCKTDDEVDDLMSALYKSTQSKIKEHPENVSYLIPILTVSRQLERMADHATNIAEDVIYMTKGEIVRHQ